MLASQVPSMLRKTGTLVVLVRLGDAAGCIRCSDTYAGMHLRAVS
jgi:hypothetical protein